MNIKNIDFNVNYISNPYKSNKSKSSKCNDSIDSVKSKKSSFSNELNKISNNSKIDTIEFSQKPINKSQNLSEIRNKIISEINKDKDIKCIEKLKTQLDTNTYIIDSEELADILLL